MIALVSDVKLEVSVQIAGKVEIAAEANANARAVVAGDLRLVDDLLSTVGCSVFGELEPGT